MKATAPIKSEIDRGAASLLTSYFGLHSGDALTVVAEKQVWNTVSYLGTKARELGIRINLQDSDQPFSALTAHFNKATVVAFVGTSQSVYASELVQFLRKSPSKTQYYRIFDFSEHLLRVAFGTRPADVESLHDQLIASLISEGLLRVTSPSGTDLSIDFPTGFTWVSTFGHYDKKFPGVLPPSEVATYSPKVNGTFVGDGAINTNFDFYKDPRLANSPLRFVIKNSIIVDFSCQDVVLSRFMNHLMTLPYANHVGEVGLGTNHGITEFVPFVSHINERAAGFHLGFGGHHQGNKLDWHADLHLDVMTNSCVMQIGGRTVFSGGKYHAGNLKQPSKKPAYELTYIDTV